MSQVLDIHLDFRSSYSYLATPELPVLKDDVDIEIRLRFGVPLAICKPDFFRLDNSQAAVYILLDWERRAEMLGLPHAWPSPDPIVQSLETLEVADDQPYIYRVTCLGMEAEKRGKGIGFATEVFRLIFGGTENWHLGRHLQDAAERCGLNFAEIEDAIKNTSPCDQEIAESFKARKRDDHWGVPTFVFDGEPFFWQDRIETLRWRLDKLGLRRRAS